MAKYSIFYPITVRFQSLEGGGKMSNSRALRRQIRARRAKGLGGLALVTSFGLLGGYLGSPRLSRAYAAPVSCPSGDTPTIAANQVDLDTALADPSIDCIEINGTINLTADLSSIGDAQWTGDRVTHGLTIFGNDPLDAIDGGGNHKGISISLGDDQLDLSLTLSNFEMRNLLGYGTQGGAVFLNMYGRSDPVTPTAKRIDLDISGMDFTGNEAQNGGAIFVRASSSDGEAFSTVTVSNNSTFTGNSATTTGGAIYVEASQYRSAPSPYVRSEVSISNSSFLNNQASSAQGGAVYATANYASTSVTMNNSDFDNNYAYGDGGAVFAYSPFHGAEITSDNSTFESNDSGGEGGALAAYTFYSGNAVVDSNLSTFVGNTAGALGGAVAARSYYGDGYVRLEYTTLSQNIATLKGGAAYAKTTTYMFYSSIVDNETSSGPAGAVYSGSDVYIENSYIGSNVAYSGVGAIYAGGSVYLDFSTMYDNSVAPFPGPDAIKALGNIVPRGSAVGSTPGVGSGWLMSGSYTPNTYSYSISTSTLTSPYSVAFHFNQAPGSLLLYPFDATTSPGSGGRAPRSGSPLVMEAPNNHLGTGVTADQVGVTRGPAPSPFTIGSRQFVASVAPTISSVSPATGSTTGGTNVTITGTNFTGASSVAFGGTPAASFTVDSPTQISAVTPSKSAGVVDVSVSTSGGTATSSSAFTFVDGGGGGGGGGTISIDASPVPPSSPSTPSVTLPTSVPLPSALKPGGSILLVNGQPVPGLVVTQNRLRNGLDAVGPGFSMEIQGQSSRGDVLPLNSSGVLQVQPGGRVSSKGTGFKTGSQATLFLDPGTRTRSRESTVRSSTLSLGSLQVDAAGSFSGSVALPGGIAVGSHILQVVGLMPDGSTRAVSIGIEVVKQVGSVKISATRSGRTVIVSGKVTGLDASVLSTTVRGVGKRKAARLSKTNVPVRQDGTFTFRFRAEGAVSVVVSAGDLRSNRVRVRALIRPTVSTPAPLIKTRPLV